MDLNTYKPSQDTIDKVAHKLCCYSFGAGSAIEMQESQKWFFQGCAQSFIQELIQQMKKDTIN